jgi:DNA repair photolyase
VFVRWDNLTIDAEEHARLPGYREPAVVRHYDAPEALDVRFYEVRAKSALNRVPERSRMPFRWTVNPYRGCTHACVYCLAPDTPILMADGSRRALGDLRAGDRIAGTRVEGGARRLVTTGVLAHWSTRKPAFRVRLDNGVELVASGDHRFLTPEGWRFVTGAGGRPHLAPGSHLLTTAARAPVPPAGPLALAPVGASGRRAGRPRAPARLRDDEHQRARAHLAVAVVRAHAHAHALTPADPGDDGRAGETLVALPPRDPAPLGDRGAAAVGPAAGAFVAVRVASIEPLPGSMRLVDITTGTGDFIADGVVSHNCFARPTHTYLDMGAARDFEREIVVKVNVPEVLRTELSRPSWSREHVAMGTNTDPYQWVESRYGLMRGIWAALRDSATPCSVLTKSPLLLRDLDLMLEVAQVTEVAANLSVPTIDEKAWRASEPHTPSPKARLEAVAELNRAGIPTGVLVAPLMPGINDAPKQVERILQAAADAGATGVGGIALHLRGEVRGIFMEWLRSYRPDLVERYEHLYRRGAYVPREEQERLQSLLRRFRRSRPEAARRRSLPNLRGLPPKPRSERPGSAPAAADRQEALF